MEKPNWKELKRFHELLLELERVFSAVLTDEAICDRAYLKRTSLYDLAVKCGIDDPSEFAARFIDFERENKTLKEAADAATDIL